MVIRRVGVWSAARLYGGISAVFGFIFGAFLAMFSVIGAGVAAGNDLTEGWVAGALGVGAIIVLPILYGLMGIVVGALGAVFYNVFAGAFGGLEIEVN